MSKLPEMTIPSPSCARCGQAMTLLAKLRSIGLHEEVSVFRCFSCNSVARIEACRNES